MVNGKQTKNDKLDEWTKETAIFYRSRNFYKHITMLLILEAAREIFNVMSIYAHKLCIEVSQ